MSQIRLGTDGVLGSGRTGRSAIRVTPRSSTDDEPAPAHRATRLSPMSLSPWLAVDVVTVPSKRARELRDAWEGFAADRLQGDDEGSGTPDVREPIVESWRRSRAAGVA